MILVLRRLNEEVRPDAGIVICALVCRICSGNSRGVLHVQQYPKVISPESSRCSPVRVLPAFAGVSRTFFCGSNTGLGDFRKMYGLDCRPWSLNGLGAFPPSNSCPALCSTGIQGWRNTENRPPWLWLWNRLTTHLRVTRLELWCLAATLDEILEHILAHKKRTPESATGAPFGLDKTLPSPAPAATQSL
jgi:hypothetical protein